MNIQASYLAQGKSRPCTPLFEVKACVIHSTAAPGQRLDVTRKYWEEHDTSAHVLIGRDDDAYMCIPFNEMAIHCGTTRCDPLTGKVYTNLVREFKLYDEKKPYIDPNTCTIGIELCETVDGTISASTVNALKNFLSAFPKLKESLFVRHYDVVGWKVCPRQLPSVNDWIRFCDSIDVKTAPRRLLAGGGV